MQSTTFRLIWAGVTLALLTALIGVVRLAWSSNSTVPALPSAISIPANTPTHTAQPPTPTPLPSDTPTSQAAPVLGNLQRISTGGFAFRPLAGYTLEIIDGVVQMSRETGVNETVGSGAAVSEADGTIFLLQGGPPADFAPQAPSNLADLFQDYVTAYAERQGVRAGAPQTVTVDDQVGLTVELTADTSTRAAVGRIVMVQPVAGWVFVMAGSGPAELWAGATANEYAAMLATVRFFAPPAPLPTPTPQVTATVNGTPTPILRPTATARSTMALTPRRAPATDRTDWTAFTNANLVNDVAAALNTIWVATDGGVVVWNKNNGTYTKYTTVDGLAANRTTAVVNCPLPGFGVLFGSAAGLQILNPQTAQWRVLNSSNSPMRFDDVTALHCDRAERFLLIGYSQHGLDLLDATTGEWTYFDQADGLQNNFVEALAVVGDQEAIWVSSGLGISVLRPDGDATFYDESNSGLETNQVRRIVVDDAGVVWLGAQDALYRFADEEWTLYDQRFVLASRFPSGAINGLAVDEEGLLWIGSSKGEICHFDPVRVRCQQFFSGATGMVGGELTSLRIGADDGIYYTTAGGGVSLYDGRRWRAFVIPDEALLGNTIHDLAEDQAGLIWIATEAGIQQLDPRTTQVVRQFTRNSSALSPTAHEVLHPATDGGIWFGALGASYFNGISWTSYTLTDGLAGSLVQAIATDSQGRVWFGTEAGLSIWNGNTFFNLTRENGLPSDNISALLADGDTMWISATGGGLFRFERNQLRLFHAENGGIPTNTITTLALDDDGALLLGNTQGVTRFYNDQATPIEALTGYVVTALAPSGAGALWAGTGGAGLFYFDGIGWSRPPGEIAPPAPEITALLVDRQGALWIGARSGGLLRYKP